MGTIIKSIKKFKDFTYVEKNRDLTIEDFTLVNDKVIDIKPNYSSKNNKGNTISITTIYELNKDILDELQNLFDVSKKTSNNYLDNNYIKNYFSCIEIRKTIDIDFRGAKTESNKKKKIDSTIEEIKSVYDKLFNLWISEKINSINTNYLNKYIEQLNTEYFNNIKFILTQEDIYIELFSGNTEYTELDSKYKEVVSKYEEIKNKKKEYEEKITQMKRDIVLDYFENNNWNLNFRDSDDKDVLPKPLVEKVKEEISNSFVKKGLFGI